MAEGLPRCESGQLICPDGYCCDEHAPSSRHECGSWVRPGEVCRACDPFDDRLDCRCGQGRVWHENGTGRCLLTGPQSGDGCPCMEFRPAR